MICTAETVCGPRRVHSTLAAPLSESPTKEKKNQPPFVTKCFLRHIIAKCALLQLSNNLCAARPVSDASRLISLRERLCDGSTSCSAMAPDQTNQFTGTMLIILAAKARYLRTVAQELKLPLREDRERGN